MNRNHKKHWESIIGLKHAKCFLQGPNAQRAEELIKLSRSQLRCVTALPTGALLPEKAPFILEPNQKPQLQKVPGRRWNFHICPVWLWGLS
jgi:hypothetical protein